MAIDTAAKRLSSFCDGMPWNFGPPFPDGTIDQGDRQTVAFTYSGILAEPFVPPVDVVQPDLTDAIRAAIVGSSCSTGLSTYLGAPAVFTRTPVPGDADYPMVVISKNINQQNEDGVDDFRPFLSYSISVYGRNAEPDEYNIVSAVAYCIRTLFHRQRNLSINQWGTTLQLCTGPTDQPSAGEITTRTVTLNVRIAQLHS
jgi:hypothetical protein